MIGVSVCSRPKILRSNKQVTCQYTSVIENNPLNQSAVWDFTGNTDISFLCNDGINELEELGCLIKRVIEEEEKTLNKKVESSKEQDIEEFSLDIYSLEEVFRRSLYYSYIVNIYSLLETKLNSICELAQKHAKIELSCEDIKGDLLERTKRYLKKLLKYDFTKNLNEQWQQIKILNKVRNIIVHHEGYVGENRLNKIDPIIKQNLIDLNGSNRIEIKHEYTVFLIKNIYKFVATICDELLMKDRNKEILVMQGKTWKYGDNINTDEIIPARYLTTSDPAELAKYCMEDLDAEFANKISPGDILVAGSNFGCGSSREHAPISIKAAGVACVIAKTFARIFFRNSFNIGLPIVECPEAAEKIQTGDVVSVDVNTGIIKNITKDETYQAKPFPEFMQELVAEGGLMNYVAKHFTSCL